MPPHYAISEALIVLAALYCGWRLFRRDQWMGAIGVLLFGAAASIGVYRFPTGQVQELAAVHRWAGQIGGLIGMGLIASECIRKALPASRKTGAMRACLIVIVISLLIALLKPALAVPLFLLWSLICIVGATALPAKSIINRFGFAALASLMLLNVVFLRQSNHLTQDVSWHAFHTLIAIWIFAIYWVLSIQTEREHLTDTLMADTR